MIIKNDFGYGLGEFIKYLLPFSNAIRYGTIRKLTIEHYKINDKYETKCYYEVEESNDKIEEHSIISRFVEVFDDDQEGE